MKIALLSAISLVMSAMLHMTAPASPPQISCDATEFDFGKVPPDKTLFHTFKLSNKSGSDCQIGGFRVSCSCVSAYTGTFVIKAGETINLDVSVRPGASQGQFRHYVYLYGPDEKTMIRFTLKHEQ